MSQTKTWPLNLSVWNISSKVNARDTTMPFSNRPMAGTKDNILWHPGGNIFLALCCLGPTWNSNVEPVSSRILMVPNRKWYYPLLLNCPLSSITQMLHGHAPMSADLQSNAYWASCVTKEKLNALNPAGMRSGKKEVNDPINGIINGYFRGLVNASIFQ